MKFDLILAGVGGQGGLSSSVVIASAAIAEGLFVKQSEVHGMSQRGGEVHATLRLSDAAIASPLIPKGAASLIISFEPLEALRYAEYLSKAGIIISATAPVTNIKNYPPLAEVFEQIREFPNHLLIDADKIAKEVGSVRSANMVMVGAASKYLPIKPSSLEKAIGELFEKKGPELVELNISAFRAGQKQWT